MVDWAAGQGGLTAGGVTLEWATWGRPPAEAPTIVLLHEGLGCIALWRDFPAVLAQATGMGVFAYSRAGYGQSGPAVLPRPLDYMTREAVEVLPEVLQKAGLGRFLLMGHSDGATIAAIHAGSVFDPQMRGLILMAPHFFAEPDGLAAIEQARGAFDAGDLRAKLAKYHADPDCAFRGWNDAWLDPDFTRWNVEDVIDHFRVPVLAVQGDADAYGTLRQIDVIHERSPAPVDRLVLPDCGHAPHLERGAETIAAISEFVARLERIEAA